MPGGGADSASDGVPTWRLGDLSRVGRERFGLTAGKASVGRLTRSLCPCWQTERPRHGPRRSQVFQQCASLPLLPQSAVASRSRPTCLEPNVSRSVFRTRPVEGGRAAGSVAGSGSACRSRMVDDQRHRSACLLLACLFGAVRPERCGAGAERNLRRSDDLRGDQAAALELASQLPPGRHVAIPIKDRLAHRAAAAGAAQHHPGPSAALPARVRGHRARCGGGCRTVTCRGACSRHAPDRGCSLQRPEQPHRRGGTVPPPH